MKYPERAVAELLLRAVLPIVLLIAGAIPGWACTVFTDRFDNQPVDGRFIRCFEVSATAGPNGSISPDFVTRVPEGDVLSFLLIPVSGYQIDQVTGCDGDIENETTYVTAPVTANCQVNAAFTNLGACSLWDQNCPSSQGCYVIDGDGTTACAFSSGKEVGEACDFINDCAPGLICANPVSSSCRPLCNTNGSVSCETGDCVEIGISNVGACF